MQLMKPSPSINPSCDGAPFGPSRNKQPGGKVAGSCGCECGCDCDENEMGLGSGYSGTFRNNALKMILSCTERKSSSFSVCIRRIVSGSSRTRRCCCC